MYNGKVFNPVLSCVHRDYLCWVLLTELYVNIYCQGEHSSCIILKLFLPGMLCLVFFFYKLSTDISRNTQFSAISVFLILIHSFTQLVSPKSCRLFLEYKRTGVFACLSLRETLLFLHWLCYTKGMLAAVPAWMPGLQMPAATYGLCWVSCKYCLRFCTTRIVAPRSEWNIVLSVILSGKLVSSRVLSCVPQVWHGVYLC